MPNIFIQLIVGRSQAVLFLIQSWTWAAWALLRLEAGGLCHVKRQALSCAISCRPAQQYCADGAAKQDEEFCFCDCEEIENLNPQENRN